MALSYGRSNVSGVDEAAQARRMRADGLSAAQIQRGSGGPAARGRSRLREERYEAALALRRDGWSVNDIARELGIAKSTAWLWVKHLPLDADSERAARKRAHSKLMTDARWAAHREERDARRAATHDDAGEWVGVLSHRELILLGAAVYWCEGSKSKPWRPQDERLMFVNSDPRLIELYLRFLEAMGVPRESLTYRVSIHETAEPVRATRWWADRIKVDVERFKRATIKRHAPVTNRHNTGEHYHGCLVIVVPKSRELYWRVEGIVQALVGVGDSAPAPGGDGDARGQQYH